MASIKVGDEIPAGVFVHVPFTPELEEHSACGIRTYPPPVSAFAQTRGAHDRHSLVSVR